jgi:hypothetical protein
MAESLGLWTTCEKCGGKYTRTGREREGREISSFGRTPPKTMLEHQIICDGCGVVNCIPVGVTSS